MEEWGAGGIRFRPCCWGRKSCLGNLTVRHLRGPVSRGAELTWCLHPYLVHERGARPSAPPGPTGSSELSLLSPILARGILLVTRL